MPDLDLSEASGLRLADVDAKAVRIADVVVWEAPDPGGYPIGPPVLKTVYKANGRASSTPLMDETAIFVSSGKPLLIVLSARAGNNTDRDYTVTVGAPGRAFGTGQAMSVLTHFRRTSSQTTVLALLAPPPGPVSVQAEAAGGVQSVQIAVFEVQGLAGVGAASGAVGGTLVTARSLSVNTTQPNSGGSCLGSGGNLKAA